MLHERNQPEVWPHLATIEWCMSCRPKHTDNSCQTDVSRMLVPLLEEVPESAEPALPRTASPCGPNGASYHLAGMRSWYPALKHVDLLVYCDVYFNAVCTVGDLVLSHPWLAVLTVLWSTCRSSPCTLAVSSAWPLIIQQCCVCSPWSLPAVMSPHRHHICATMAPAVSHAL